MRNLSIPAAQSFWSELEKIAVSTEQIAEGVGRVNPINLGGFSGLKRLITRPRETWGLVKMLGVRAALTGTLDPAFSTMTKAQAKAHRATLRAHNLHQVPENLRESIYGYPGRIITLGPSAVAAQVAPGVKLSPQGKRAVHDIAVLHEAYERGVKPKDFHLSFSVNRGHRSPEVLLKEHNLVSRVQGPGSDEARKVFRDLRAGRGEAQELEAALVGSYGPRAREFLREGEKIPKAMRKNFLSKLRTQFP